VDSLSIINEPYYTTSLSNISHLAAFLPSNLDNYFTYTGSLTTPPCSEGVRWIDFKHPVKLSHAQVSYYYKRFEIAFCETISHIKILNDFS